MGSFKSIFGVARAAVPVLYGLYLLASFLDDGGSGESAWGIGPGPAAIGLGAVALLFFTPKILKLVRMVRSAQVPSPRSASDDSDEDDGGAAADAIIARYMARQAEEAKISAPASRPAPPSGGPARRPSFGRKI